MSRRPALLAALACAAMLPLSAAHAAVDFARDIQPLFEKHCYECHGPKKQRNGFRLDRRSRAMSGVTRHNIIPGSSVTSRVYRRILDGTTGTQMPPEEALTDEQVEIVRRWIDEGAHWPDELANEADLPPPDPGAIALIKHVRAARGDTAERQRVLEAIAREPQSINARGADGATPLMYAALYGDAELLRAMLAAGGNPNLASDSGATALMWSIEDLEKTRLLLDSGADVNATSGFGRTALSLSTLSAALAPTTELLLARGAQPMPLALNMAASHSERQVRDLLSAGATDKGDAAGSALRAACFECFHALMPASGKLPRGLLSVLPPASGGKPQQLRVAIDHGADVKVRDIKGRTALILLAISENAPPEIVQELIDRGADVHARSAEGLNALDYALRLGRQPIIDVFTRAGLKPTTAAADKPAFVAGNSVRAAITRSLPLLQTSSKTFYDKGGCVGCHHNLQLGITVKQARRAGFALDESLVREELTELARDIDATREQALEGIVAPGGQATATGYVLLALSEQNFPATEGTDAMARLLRLLQKSDGRWVTPIRPPIESSEFTATAVSARGLIDFGRDNPAASQAAVARARHWLETQVPVNHEDRVFRLLGLVWVDSPRAMTRAAVRALLGTQRRDGAWAQTAHGSSDAYATGQALYALRAAGVATGSRAYKRGVRYLLDTQLADGTWWVRTRSLPTQTYFESGFPHGRDQYISAAATHWATQALLLTLPDQAPAARKMAAR